RLRDCTSKGDANRGRIPATDNVRSAVDLHRSVGRARQAPCTTICVGVALIVRDRSDRHVVLPEYTHDDAIAGRNAGVEHFCNRRTTETVAVFLGELYT